MIKQAEQPTVVLNIEKVLADRIWTEFCNDSQQQVIAKNFQSAIQDALRTHKQTARDEALIPVTVHVTVKQARTILEAFKPFIGFPHDYRVYKAVSDAIKGE